MFKIFAHQYRYGQQFPEQMLLYMSSSYIANYVKLRMSELTNVSDVKAKQLVWGVRVAMIVMEK
jgi:hypothetical protein